MHRAPVGLPAGQRAVQNHLPAAVGLAGVGAGGHLVLSGVQQSGLTHGVLKGGDDAVGRAGSAGDRVHLALIFHNGGLEVVNLGASDVGGLVGGVDGAGGDDAVGYLDGDADVPAVAPGGAGVGHCLALGAGGAGLRLLLGAGGQGEQHRQREEQGKGSFHNKFLLMCAVVNM